MDLWAYHNRVQIDFSRPRKPTDNAYVESFNGTLRAECLDVHWFATLTEAKQLIEAWRREYNESRPHRSLGERTPNDLLHNCRRLTLELLQKEGTDHLTNLSYYPVNGNRGQVNPMQCSWVTPAAVRAVFMSPARSDVQTMRGVCPLPPQRKK